MQCVLWYYGLSTSWIVSSGGLMSHQCVITAVSKKSLNFTCEDRKVCICQNRCSKEQDWSCRSSAWWGPWCNRRVRVTWRNKMASQETTQWVTANHNHDHKLCWKHSVVIMTENFLQVRYLGGRLNFGSTQQDREAAAKYHTDIPNLLNIVCAKTELDLL